MSLPRVDSTSAFSSLLGYAASDSESDEEKTEQGEKSESENTEKKPAESELETKMKRYATRLVSYPGDEGDEGNILDDSTEMGEDAMEVVTEEQDGEETSNDNVQLVNSAYLEASINSTIGSSFAESIKNKPSDEVTLPPEPQGRCSKHLQDKISKCYRKYANMNPKIQNNKEFRNPSIYEKLISYLSIDQLGTNYPKEMYDPHVWEESSYYEALAKAQREDMAKREKEKKEKTKVEFVTGVAKKILPIDKQSLPGTGGLVSTGTGASTSTAQILGEEPERKRKSKWGMQTNPNLLQQQTTIINPLLQPQLQQLQPQQPQQPNRPQVTMITTTVTTHPVVEATTTASTMAQGTRPTTVISSVGTLKKPKVDK